MKRFVLILALVVVGCTPDFDDASLIKDLRLIAVVADPPEVLVDMAALSGGAPPVIPTFTLTPLVVDPAGAGRPISYQVVACGNDPGATTLSEDDPVAGRVRDTIAEAPCGADAVAVAQGTAAPAPDGTVPFTVSFTPTADLLVAAAKGDPLGLELGLPLTISFTVKAGDEEVVAIKRVIFSPRLSPTQMPNANPQIVDLLARHDPQAPQTALAATDQREVAFGDVLRLLPSGTIAESYDIRSFSNDQRAFVTDHIDHETLRFSFFATHGTFSPRVTTTNPPLLRDDPIIDLSSTYQAPVSLPPGADPLVRVFVVARDERGGASFIQRTLRLP